MNQFFYEQRGKEKVNDLMREGMTSQALHRSETRKPGVLRHLPKLVVVIAGILGLITFLVR